MNRKNARCGSQGFIRPAWHHLQKCQGLQVNVIVARGAAGLADVTDHDCHAPLVGVGVAIASLHAMSVNIDLHAVQANLMLACKRHGAPCRRKAHHQLAYRLRNLHKCRSLRALSGSIMDEVSPGYRPGTRSQSTPCKPLSWSIQMTCYRCGITLAGRLFCHMHLGHAHGVWGLFLIAQSVEYTY